MSWIGLRDARGGVFSAVGLGRVDRTPFDLNAVLAHGTVMFEFASDPRVGDQTLLNYGATHPWAAGGPDGDNRIRQHMPSAMGRFCAFASTWTICAADVARTISRAAA